MRKIKSEIKYEKHEDSEGDTHNYFISIITKEQYFINQRKI